MCIRDSLQPAGDLSPGWERAELAEEVLMIDAVESRCQVCVQGPPPLGIRTLGDVEDGLDRIMAATARPKAIGLRFEPCFPLGLQRVDDPGLAVSYTHLRAHETR